MLLQKKERGVRAYTPWQIHRGGLTPPRESKPMRIQVVEHDANDLGVGIGGDDVPHAVREFDLGTSLHDQDIAPTLLGFADHHQIAHAVTLVLGVLTRRPARFNRQRCAHFANQLLRTFVEAHHRTCRIIRCRVQVKHVFHRGDKLRADLRNAPLLHLPGLQGVFLRGGGRFHG